MENKQRLGRGIAVTTEIVPGMSPGHKVARACGAATVLVGLFVLVGWAADIPVLKSMRPGLATMKANTALAFLLAGLSLWGIIAKGRASTHLRWVGLSCALAVTTVAMLTLAQCTFTLDLGIDQLLFRDGPGSPGTSFPGRMAPITALIFFLIGMALLLLDTGQAPRLAQALCSLALFGSFLCCLSYLYGTNSLFPVSWFSSVALHTTVTLVFLSLGVLAAFPNTGLVGLFASEAVGGVLARRLLPPVIVVPVLLGWLRVTGERAGLYGMEFGIALFALVNISIFATLVCWTAAHVERSESGRLRATQSLRESEERYRVLTEALPHMVWIMRPDLTLEFLNRRSSDFTALTVDEVNARGWERLIHPDDLPRMKAAVSGPLERGQTHEVEYRFLHHTGEYRWVISKAVPLKNDAGDVIKWIGSTLDIHDRWLAERRFRVAVEASPVGVFLANLQGKIVLGNSPFEHMFGYDKGELLGAPVERLMPERYRDHHASYRSLYFADPQTKAMGGGRDLWGLRKDGSEFPVEIVLKPVHMEDGLHVLASVIDISGRRAAEQQMRELNATLERRVAERTAALQESEEKFRSAFESASIGVALVAPDGRWLRVNRSLCELVGYTEQELLAIDFQTITHPDDLEANLSNYRQMLAGTIRKYQMEKRYLHKRGHIVPALLSVSLVRDATGHPLYFISQIQDITQRNQAENALAAKEVLLRQFIKHSPAAIAMFDTNMRYLQCSDRWLTDYHLSGKDLTGLSHYEVFPDIPDKWKLVHQRVLAGAVESCDEDPFHRPDGSTEWLQWECRPWHAATEEIGGLIMSTQVVTERKLSKERIKASLREKEALLKEIHHRVKNNLQIVSTLLDLQADHTQDFQALEMFKESWGRVRSMALIHERLYRSQDMARVDFAEYVRHLADDLYRAYKLCDDGIRLELDVDIPPLPIDAAIPCGLLLNELMSNCFKHAFNEATEGLIGVSLCRSDDETNVLSVSDDGAGFPGDIDFRHTTSFGMQLVNTLVDQLAGEIELTTGRGTTFTVRFPTTKKQPNDNGYLS
jgi:PAS domain S-box-containing protein